MKKLKFKLLLLCISMVLAFLLGEVVYRSFRGRYNPENKSDDQYEFYRYDKLLGWSNSPGRKGIHYREAFGKDNEIDVEINEHGMRQGSVETEKADGVHRIAWLGDSFLWGFGVQDEERISELVSSKFANVESLNFGVSGYSPVQYTLLMECDRITKFDPDLIVILFCLGNDFGDNVLYERYKYFKPYALLKDDGDVLILGIPPDRRKFENHPPIFGSYLISDLILQFRRQDSQKGLLGFKDNLLQLDEKDLSTTEVKLCESAVEINTRLLERIKKAAGNVPVLIVAAPSKSNFKNGVIETRTFEWLEKSCKEAGLPVVNTLKTVDLDDFWEDDGHWNKLGTQKMANRVAQYLKDQGNNDETFGKFKWKNSELAK